MKTRKFQMNGKVYESMAAIAKELGVNRVRPSQFDKYGITEITDAVTVDTKAVETAKAEEPVKADTKPVSEKDSSKKKPAKKAVKTTSEEAKKTEDKEEVKANSSDDKAAMETKSGDDETLEEYSKRLKKSSMDDLVKYAEEAGVDVYESIINEQIRRMRITMALKAHYYPNEKLEVKKATGFKKIDLDTLIKAADERGLKYKKVDFPAIQRMWVTKALTDAGVTVDDLSKAEDTTQGGGKESK